MTIPELSCTQVTGSPPRGIKTECQAVHVKEFYGARDIEANIDYIRRAYASMPPTCHSLKRTTDVDSLLKPYLKRHVYVLVATELGEVIGFAVGTKSSRTSNGMPPCLFVHQLCTTQTCRGGGRALLEHMMTISLKTRLPYICLESVPSAKGFYERLGFAHWNPARPNARLSSTNKKSYFMTVNVLWYFTCWVRAHLSNKDRAVILQAIK